MQGPECVVKRCKNQAIGLYGSSWVCGKCMVKLIEKEKQEKIKRVREQSWKQWY